MAGFPGRTCRGISVALHGNFNDPLVAGRARCPHGRVDHEAYRGETFWAFVVSSVVWYRWCAFLFDGVAVNVLGPDLFNAA